MDNPRGRVFFRGRRGLPRAPIHRLTRPNITPRSILLQYTPLHTQDLIINPQHDSPLYNGRIPPEIRDQIFSYALTEFTKSDPESQYPTDTNFKRPGYTGKRALTIALLSTCRRTYMETYHLPMIRKEHVFYHRRHPPGFVQEEKQYFDRMVPWQLAMVKEVQIFVQLFWLEQSFPNLARQEFMQGIEKLTLTIRRGDWWYNESNAPLVLNPQRGDDQNVDMMNKDWRDFQAGNPIPWDESSYGYAFSHMAFLKELTLELETSEDKLPELKAIVEKAKTWKWPMKDGMVLSADGLPVTSMQWRSDASGWSDQCPHCNTGDHFSKYCQAPPEALAEKCKEFAALRKEGLGPMFTVFRLRYKLAKGDGLR